MKNWLIYSLLACSIHSFSQQFPQKEISNGVLKAVVYLPEKTKGYYQGTRFDWAGVVPSLKYKNHEYFGVWNPVYSQGLHDAIVGPVEEFMEVGYDEAQTGETFIRIGVGTLVKPEEDSQSRFKLYEIKEEGKRKIKSGKSFVWFRHKLKGDRGYAYVYEKELKLVDNKLVLSHSLKNTGKRVIETSVYNHNFFVIDGENTNQNIKTTFAYTPKGAGKGFDDLAGIEGNSLIYLKELRKGENVFSENISGFGRSASDHEFTIENLKSGARVRVKGDQPLEKMVFWASYTTSCPEPYVKLKAMPGNIVKWKTEYEFNSLF